MKMNFLCQLCIYIYIGDVFIYLILRAQVGVEVGFASLIHPNKQPKEQKNIEAIANWSFFFLSDMPSGLNNLKNKYRGHS